MEELESNEMFLSRKKELETDFLLQIERKDAENDRYATKKSVGQGYLNTAGIQMIIALLIPVLIDGKPLTSVSLILIVSISSSLVLQFVIFTLIVILANSKSENLSKKCDCTATATNNLVTTLSGLLLIITTVTAGVSGYTSISRNTTLA